ncbi:response regulator [Sediminibacterium sp.]|uniref:DNA-binding response regulator n=1 Tax=Sediminibacterium sp. TaxID=1917865 RepID=UPI0027263827|nr:response regulator [Sediminibacterium sp.]MDO8996824.1 response regulator [Sediminibacterium sp.]MDP1971499.1 response regulator [Sediminibacterium sp.]MDP2422499.1 response regulator [Sediminibacterium sp.]
MIRLAVVEDNIHTNRIICEKIKESKELTLVANTYNGYDFLYNLNCLKVLPDAVIIDIEMPKIDGLICTSYLNLKYPQIKIIGVSYYANISLIAEFITEGASCFISKHFCHPEAKLFRDTYGKIELLNHTIRIALNNESFIDKILINESKTIHKSISTKKNRNKYTEINSTSLEEYLILNAANLSFPEIGMIMNKSIHSIKNYYSKLSEIFEVNNRAELTSYCIKYGLVKLPFFYESQS